MNTSLKINRNEKESLSSAEKISSIAGHNSPRTKFPRSLSPPSDLEPRSTERPAIQFGWTELTCKSVHSPNYLGWLESDRATKEARHFVIVELSWLARLFSPVDFSRLESDRAVRKPLVHVDNYLTQPWCLFDCKDKPTFGSWVGLHDCDNYCTKAILE